MNPKKNLQRRAFTLIEIMVAIAIFAILVAAVYSTWLVILKSSQVAQEAAAQVQRRRIAVRTLEDSLTCLQSFQASMQYYGFYVTNGDAPTLSFVARLPDIFPRNGRFDSNLRRLTFAVEPPPANLGGESSEKDLVLRQNEILKDMDPDEQADPLVLARNVKSFVVECWDTNAMDWATEWDDTNSIPTLVRVTLVMNGNSTGNSASTLAITREIATPSEMLPTPLEQPRIAGGGGGGGGKGTGGNGQIRNRSGGPSGANNGGNHTGPPNGGGFQQF